MRVRSSVLGTAVAVAVVAVMATSALAQAGSSLPTPGTAAQVSSLVSKSLAIKTLPSNLVPSLSAASGDLPGLYYPTANSQCTTAIQCDFGDLAATTTVVLFGDSHAQMWLPALVPVATSLHFKLILIWRPGCPETDVSTTPQCDTFRTQSITLIKSLKPALVLLANKTSDVVGPGFGPFTDAKWESGQKLTITQLASTTTKVAVIGDVSLHASPVPQCLAAYSTNVQKCTIKYPNPRFVQHFAAEKAAATSTKAGYIATEPWLCQKNECSPVIGNMVVYFDAGHVASTYAEYLSGVWQTAVKKYLP